MKNIILLLLAIVFASCTKPQQLFVVPKDAVVVGYRDCVPFAFSKSDVTITSHTTSKFHELFFTAQTSDELLKAHISWTGELVLTRLYFVDGSYNSIPVDTAFLAIDSWQDNKIIMRLNGRFGNKTSPQVYNFSQVYIQDTVIIQ